jgi:hypothetical protein
MQADCRPGLAQERLLGLLVLLIRVCRHLPAGKITGRTKKAHFELFLTWLRFVLNQALKQRNEQAPN